MPNLARAPRNASSSVQIWPVPSQAIASRTEFVLDGFEAQRKDLQRGVPIDRFKVANRIAQIRRRCAVGRA